MPRYVILHHTMPPEAARGDHFDVMLERDGVLLTWAVDDEPAAGKSLAAERLSGHRLAYLTYEGPISDNRGEVSRWDEGEYEVVQESDSRWVVRFAGGRIDGEVTLLTRE